VRIYIAVRGFYIGNGGGYGGDIKLFNSLKLQTNAANTNPVFL
jgi:hypothetical protein